MLLVWRGLLPRNPVQRALTIRRGCWYLFPLKHLGEGMSSILSGYIHCFACELEAVQHNREVLSQLPECGAYLVRSMFSFLPNSRGHCYYGHLIHFAAFYKEFYIYDPEWLQEFEALLERLHWDSGEVLHTWSGERRIWRSARFQEPLPVRGIPISSREVLEDLRGATQD